MQTKGERNSDAGLGNGRALTHAVLDTNAFYNDRSFSSAAAQRLLLAARREWLEVIVPQVVAQESARQFDERARELVVEVRGAAATAERLGLDSSSLRQWATTVEEARGGGTDPLDAFKEKGLNVAPMPDVSLESMVERELARQRPFKANGLGYRDALIWFTVIQVARVASENLGLVAFVTNNVTDFASHEDNARPHNDLVADLEQAGVPPDTVVIFQSIRQLVDAMGVEDRSGILALDLAAADRPDKHPKPTSLAGLREMLADHASELVGLDVLTFDDYEAAPTGVFALHTTVPPGVHLSRLLQVHSDFVPTFVEGKPQLDGSIAWEVYVSGCVELLGYVDAAQDGKVAKGMPDYRILEVDDDGASVEISLPAEVYFFVEYDPRLDVVTAVEFDTAWESE